MERQTARWPAVAGIAALAGVAAGLRRWRRATRRADRSVAEAMTWRPVCVEVTESAQVAARRLAEEGVGALPVCRDGRPVGILTDRDMVLRVLAQAEDPRALTVGECLHGEVAAVEPSHSLGEAAEQMSAHGVRRLPVVEGGRLVGMVTQTDLADHDPVRAGQVERALARRGADVASAAWLFHRSYREAA